MGTSSPIMYGIWLCNAINQDTISSTHARFLERALTYLVLLD